MKPARPAPDWPLAATGAAWLKLWEISAAAPLVMGLRMAAMATAGAAPTAASRRESLRMGQEKLDAGYDAALAINRRLLEAHLALYGLLWHQGWAAVLSPAAAAATASRLGPRLVTDGITPFHRRVVANRRRLSRRR